jgi:hypothetical protein
MGERRRVAPQGGGEPSVWLDQSGKASIRGILALAVIIGMVYFGMKVLPVRASTFQFADAIRDEVMFAGGRRYSDETIRRNLVNVAANLGLPIQSGDIRIRRPARNIVVEVNYTVALEFIGGFTYQWNFSPKSEGPVIF